MFRTNRVTPPRLLCALLVLPGIAMLGDAAVADEHESLRRPADSAAAALYREECGSCHVPFPARGLPPSSWRAVMAQLDRHFGTDASIDPAVGRKIGSWLEANANREPAKPAAKPAAKPVLRLTETQWFRHEHDEIGADVFRRPRIKGAANCGACHPRAAEGRYSEHEIRIPR